MGAEAIGALEKRRRLKRREAPEDRREEILSLTPLGQDAYAEIIPRALAFEKALLAGLGPQVKTLLAALERIEAQVGVHPERLSPAHPARAPCVSRACSSQRKTWKAGASPAMTSNKRLNMMFRERGRLLVAPERWG